MSRAADILASARLENASAEEVALEDGSLLVDALALALLCQHVGGTR